jgi:hypothetical protein
LRAQKSGVVYIPLHQPHRRQYQQVTLLFAPARGNNDIVPGCGQPRSQVSTYKPGSSQNADSMAGHRLMVRKKNRTDVLQSSRMEVKCHHGSKGLLAEAKKKKKGLRKAINSLAILVE